MDEQERVAGKIGFLILLLAAIAIGIFAVYLCLASIASGYLAGLGFFGPAALLAYIVGRYAYHQYQELKAHE
jgi:hypothetical protein